MDRLKSYTEMSKFCCTTDLIRFTMNEAEKMMKGSVQEDNLFIVHDALVLMTAKETMKWMRKNSYLYIDGCFPSIDCRTGPTPTVLLLIAPSLCL